MLNVRYIYFFQTALFTSEAEKFNKFKKVNSSSSNSCPPENIIQETKLTQPVSPSGCRVILSKEGHPLLPTS